MNDAVHKDICFWDRAASKRAATPIADMDGYNNILGAVSQ